MSLHILFDGRTIRDGWHGVGRYAYHLVEHLARRNDVEITLLTPTVQAQRLSPRDLPQSVTRIYTDLGVTSLRGQWVLPQLIRQIDPDVAFFPYHASAPLTSTARTVVAVQDCIFETQADYAPNTRTRLAYVAGTRVILSRTDRVMTVSKLSQSQISRRYAVDPSLIPVVRPAVDRRFAEVPDEATMMRARRQLGLPDRYVLHVGMRRPHKNHELAIRAFARIRRAHPDVRLVLVGGTDRKFHDSVPKLIEALGIGNAVVELQHVPEDLLPAVYRQCDVLLHPSRLEGYGLPPAEAMAAGVAVVASTGTPAVTELSVPGGARILEPYDSGAWAETLHGLLADESARRRLGERGAKVVQRWTWDDAAADLVGVLSK